jgi:hypothetical protein
LKNTPPTAGQPVAAEQGAVGAWLTPGRFAGILALLLLACFPSVILGLEAFVYEDTGQFAYPVASFFRESFWRGEIPLWNPLNSCGIPFLAQWNTLVCYPPSLFYLLFPMPWSFDIFCLGHILLAAMGMYFLARHWTNDRLAAAVAGIVFGFNGLTWQAVMWPHFLAALAWMPWFLLAMEKAWNRGGRALLPAALAGAMQMLSGGAEVIIQTWLLLGAMWTFRFFCGEVPRGKLIFRTLIVGLAVAGLSAIQIFPFLDLIAHSQRTSSYGSGGMNDIASMTPAGILNYLVPLFHCERNPQGLFVQIGQSWVMSYYVGIGALALALLALWRVRDRRVWFWGGVVVFSWVMALGESGLVYSLVKKILPFLGFIRFSVKFVALATFAIPVLAAFGVNRLNSTPLEQWRREWGKAKILVAALIAAVVAIWLFAWVHPAAGEDFTAITQNVAVRILALALIFGCFALLRGKLDLKLQRLMLVGMLALLWFDVFTQASNPSPTAPRSVLEPGMVRSFFNWDHQVDAGVSRALQSRDSFWKMFSTGSKDPAIDTLFRRRALSMDFNLLDDVAKLDGFYSSDLKEHLEIFKRVFFTTNDAVGLKDFLGVSRVSNPTNIFDWVPRDSFLPLVTAGQQPVFANDIDTLGALFSANFEPRRTIYLPPEAADKIHATAQANAKIISTRFSAQRLEIETEADASAIVSIAQTYYHPWHAYVDGMRVQLWRANEAFQAVEVPAGKHRLNLVYEDSVFRWGAVVSLLTMLVCAVGWFWSFWKSAKQPTSARPTQAGETSALPT